MVGATGFEPATTRPPDECATRLRYAPTGVLYMGGGLIRQNLKLWFNYPTASKRWKVETILIALGKTFFVKVAFGSGFDLDWLFLPGLSLDFSLSTKRKQASTATQKVRDSHGQV